jgi:hypothetical protein
MRPSCQRTPAAIAACPTGKGDAVGDRTEQRSRARGRWASPRSGADEQGLSWEDAGRRERSRLPAAGRAIRWRALAVVTLAALLAGTGLVLARGTTGTADQTPVVGREDAPSGEATAGSCLASIPGAGSTDLDVLPCGERHLGEVVGVVELPDDTSAGGWPGEEQVASLARTACKDAFEEYVGTPADASALGLVVVPPGEVGWRAGTDRAAVCIAEGPELVGSVRGSGR